MNSSRVVALYLSVEEMQIITDALHRAASTNDPLGLAQVARAADSIGLKKRLDAMANALSKIGQGVWAHSRRLQNAAPCALTAREYALVQQIVSATIDECRHAEKLESWFGWIGREGSELRNTFDSIARKFAFGSLDATCEKTCTADQASAASSIAVCVLPADELFCMHAALVIYGGPSFQEAEQRRLDATEEVRFDNLHSRLIAVDSALVELQHDEVLGIDWLRQSVPFAMTQTEWSLAVELLDSVVREFVARYDDDDLRTYMGTPPSRRPLTKATLKSVLGLLRRAEQLPVQDTNEPSD